MIGQQATSQRCRHFSVLRGRAGETNIGEVVVRYHAHTADPVLGTAGGSPRLKRLTICPVQDSVTDSVPEKLVIQDAVGQREPNDRALWRKVLRLEDNFMYPFDRGHLPLSVCLSPEISLPNAPASTSLPCGTSQFPPSAWLLAAARVLLR